MASAPPEASAPIRLHSTGGSLAKSSSAGVQRLRHLPCHAGPGMPRRARGSWGDPTSHLGA